MFCLLSFQAVTATGTCGMVSWHVKNLSKRLLVMWSIPYDFNLHHSYFAIGMLRNQRPRRFYQERYWYTTMYKAPVTKNSAFLRAKGGETLAITTRDKYLHVTAHLEGNTYTPMLNISVMPQFYRQMDPGLWKAIYQISSGGGNHSGAGVLLTTFSHLVLTLVMLLCANIYNHL